MGKKILSMFLVLCMVLGMLPGSARAEAVYADYDAGKEATADESEGTGSGLAAGGSGPAVTATGSAITMDLWIGGEKVTEDNMSNINDQGIAYDPVTNTLTLDGAEIDGAFEDVTGNKYGIYASGDLKIKLVNNPSYISCVNLDSPEHDSIGIYVAGNLLIEGDQTLLVASGNAENGYSCGIMVGGNLTIDISIGERIGIFAGEAKYSYGICNDIYSTVSGTTLTIMSGEVGAYGSKASEESGGISWLGEVEVEGGASVEATGYDSEGVSSGITAGSITIDGGMVEANGGSAADSHGINGFTFTINGGKAIANADSANGESCGIHVMGVEINGGTLEANGGSATESHGINALTFTINDGTAEANGGPGTDSSYGIFIYGGFGSFLINGGKVTASSFGDKYQAFNIAPAYNETKEYAIFAGDNPTDGIKVSKDELETVINNDGYRYIEFETVVYYDIWVGDVQVTSLNKDNIVCEDEPGHITGNITYDPGLRTLTLENANIYVAYEDEYGNRYGIYSDAALNIERIGHNAIAGNGINAGHNCAGIYVNGDLTVSGNGTLVANGGAANDGDSYGIYVNGGVLVVIGGKLIASASPVKGSSSASCGIAVYDGDISIGEDADVEAFGYNSEFASFGVFIAGKGVTGTGANLAVIDGILKAGIREDEAWSGETKDNSYGIYFFDADGTLLLRGGRVEAVSNQADIESAGIAADKVVVNNGVLDAYGKSEGFSIGIIGDIEINGGKVYAYTDGTASGSRAMSSAPVFASGKEYQISAGSDRDHEAIVTETELSEKINDYKYIQIETIEYYGLWIGDVPVTSMNNDNITCEHIVTGYVSYDPDTQTLTLEDAYITDTAYEDGDGCIFGIYSNLGLNIKLIGDSSIVIPAANKNKNATGIYVNGDLTIDGEGSLFASSGPVAEDEQGNSFGLYVDGGVDGGNLLIMGGNLTVFGASASGTYSGSYGICVDNGDLIVSNNAALEAAGDTAAYESIGIYLGKDGANLVINSGSLEVSGAAAGNYSYGIYFETAGTLTVEGGSLTAISSEADTESGGIYADKVIVNAGLLDAFGNSEKCFSFGIYSKSDDIEINGGSVYAYSGEGNGSRAMNAVPRFAAGYSHRINAGTNGADAVYVTDDVFARNIAGYTYVEITPYIPGGGSGGGGGSYTPVPDSTPAKDATENTSGSVEVKVEIKAEADTDGAININLTEKDIADAIAAARKEAKKNGIDEENITLVINVSADVKDSSGFTANLSKAVQKLIIDSNISGIEFVIGNSGIAIGISNSALAEISRQAGTDIQISVEKADNLSLSAEAQDSIGNRPVYEFNAGYQDGSKKVSNFGDGRVYISIPYTPAKGEEPGYLHIVYVDEKGNVSIVTESVYDENSKSLHFAVNHFSVYGVGYSDPKNKFTDIKNHWAKDSIDYAVSKGFLSGIKKTKFAPDNAITREALAMALGKLAGIDAKAYTKNSFTDVKDDSQFRPYIEWAYNKGIMENTGDREFNPKGAITREEIALIMDNFVKAMKYKLPAVRAEVKFADASVIGSKYADAVKAMQQAGIMTVRKNNKFIPKYFVTRAEFCTMLHRFVKVTINPDIMAQEWSKNDVGQYMYYKDGNAVTGWLTLGSKTYYFDTYGILVSGKWKEIDGNWYYFDKDGILTKNTTIDGFEVDEKGVRKAE